MLSASFTGFFTSFSLILAIGAQNAFVLRQGLIRAHVFWLCLLCATSDALLITLGVTGFGALVTALPWLPKIMALAGAGFLIVYGMTRFSAALKGDYELVINGVSKGLWATLATGAAFTWLNPHVYLDTLGLIGAISTRYLLTAEKIAFGIAAVAASFVFFFSLGYGARLLSPVMQNPRAWRVFDCLVGGIMWLLAFGLIRHAVT